jgi:DNA polymerase-3 subunit delta'
VRRELPRGHAEIVDGLLAATKNRRLPHALLFAGPDGVGKYLAAEWLAAGILCAKGPARPCGSCGPEKRLEAGSHPDFLAIDPDSEGEEEIKIGRITYRERDPRPNVGDFLSLLPMEGGWRIVLVRDAERMTDEAQNALLKTLEEPGRSTLLVLVTARPESLLPTTTSRCVRVDFRPLEREVAGEILRAHGIPPEEAASLARFAGGSPGLAIALRERGALRVRAILEGVLCGALDPMEAAREIGELPGEFPGKTPTARARARTRAALDLALDVLGDLVRLGAGIDPAELAHGDLAPSAPTSPGGDTDLALSRLGRRLELCSEARQDVEANLAPDAILERALLALEPRAIEPEATEEGAPGPGSGRAALARPKAPARLAGVQRRPSNLS